MNYQGGILGGIRELCVLFASHCGDRTTLDQLVHMVEDRSRWRGAHNLFQQIRAKTLKAIARKDRQAELQYYFEEICAKSLYNLSGEPAPFDSDSPYWIIPNALKLAREVGVDESEITRIVAG
jgi:hypothetical protein